MSEGHLSKLQTLQGATVRGPQGRLPEYWATGVDLDYEVSFLRFSRVSKGSGGRALGVAVKQASRHLTLNPKPKPHLGLAFCDRLRVYGSRFRDYGLLFRFRVLG